MGTKIEDHHGYIYGITKIPKANQAVERDQTYPPRRYIEVYRVWSLEWCVVLLGTLIRLFWLNSRTMPHAYILLFDIP